MNVLYYYFNTLDPVGFGNNLKSVIFQPIFQIDIFELFSGEGPRTPLKISQHWFW